MIKTVTEEVIHTKRNLGSDVTITLKYEKLMFDVPKDENVPRVGDLVTVTFSWGEDYSAVVQDIGRRKRRNWTGECP